MAAAAVVAVEAGTTAMLLVGSSLPSSSYASRALTSPSLTAPRRPRARRRRWHGSHAPSSPGQSGSMGPIVCAGGVRDGGGREGGFMFDFSVGGKGSGAASQFADMAVLAQLRALGCGEVLSRPREVHFSGSTNEAYEFKCSNGNFFVKINRHFTAEQLFEGEAAGLQAMIESAGALKVPKPLACGDLPDGAGSYLVMEHIAVRPFGMIQPTSQESLGRLLASMHVTSIGTQERYGFSCNTSLGIMPLANELNNSWADFFMDQRLDLRLQQVCERLGEDARADELREAYGRVCSRVKGVLKVCEAACRPCVLHGDLWLGNSGLSRVGEVAIFDPACFYGHSEFDLAFRDWPVPGQGFPGFSDAFYAAYHEVLPRQDGFEVRHAVYQLFHLLNHMAIYGEQYMPAVLQTMQRLDKELL
eukprot:jgi/Chlat1/6508/Chrsp45S05992